MPDTITQWRADVQTQITDQTEPDSITPTIDGELRDRLAVLVDERLHKSGNSFGAIAIVGTNDNYAMYFRSNNVNRGALQANGNWSFGSVVDAGYGADFAGTARVQGAFTASGASVIGTSDYTPNDAVNVSYTVRSRTGIYVANAANNFGIEYGGGRIYGNVGAGANNPVWTPSSGNWTTGATVAASAVNLSASDAILIQASGGVIRATGGDDRSIILRGGTAADNPKIQVYGKTATAGNAGIIAFSDITAIRVKTSLIFSGSGTPEGAVTAPVSSIFLRTDGGAGTSFYVKESGTGNTGWVAK